MNFCIASNAFFLFLVEVSFGSSEIRSQITTNQRGSFKRSGESNEVVKRKQIKRIDKNAIKIKAKEIKGIKIKIDFYIRLFIAF
jgi:hypothetical protein